MAEFIDPFDISKPNLHDTKAEFLKEKKAIEAAIKTRENYSIFSSLRTKMKKIVTLRLNGFVRPPIMPWQRKPR